MRKSLIERGILKVGDEIVVKNLGLDQRGRLNLSRKAAMENVKTKEENN